MAIQMIGIDHNRAAVDVRARFSFTKKQMQEALETLKAMPEISGSVILSTCNRMELWISTGEDVEISLYDILCKLKGLDGELYKDYFIERTEEEAVEHLFLLACGLQSRILGEDQILTQVKTALQFAREQYSTDNVLEILFRMAVTAAKKVKTDIRFSSGNQSAIHGAIESLKEQGHSFDGKKVLVIGNGEMGRMAAEAFLKEGADVTVTVRQYRSGVVQIPRGCRQLPYGDRMQVFPVCNVVVSATASPNFTITKALTDSVRITQDMILLDLAVPRDVEPVVGAVPHIQLYDIDSFKIELRSEQQKQQVEQAQKILQEKIEEFFDWYECRDMIPRLQQLNHAMTQDLLVRIRKTIRQLPLSGTEQEELLHAIGSAASKSSNKMLFDLKDSIEDTAFRQCVEGLEKVYRG